MAGRRWLSRCPPSSRACRTTWLSTPATTSKPMRTSRAWRPSSPACRAPPRTRCWAITTTGRSGGQGGRNDVRRLRAVLSAAGVQVLANTAQVVHGGRLAIAGVDDPATGRDDAERALPRVPATACNLLLAHSPDVAPHLGARRPRPILAGHTPGRH